MSNPIKNLAGKRFGRLVVVRMSPKRSLWGGVRWVCLCDCGKEKTVSLSNLSSGATVSCGCYNRDSKITHGLTADGRKHPLYWRWMQMRGRCCNPNNDRYRFYGGRGIKMCERWMKFENFYADMSPTWSPELTLERRDNDADYSPENCVWANWTKQANNKRNNRLLTFAGKTLTVAQWGREIGVVPQLISSRLKYGWDLDRVLTKERHPKKA